MSSKGVANVLEKLLTDDDFRSTYKKDVDKALADFDLDADERAAFAGGMLLQVDKSGELSIANLTEAVTKLVPLQSKRRYA